jgi:VIT1/CCC1 family predicted Fe2+/Mn2+ transporter
MQMGRKMKPSKLRSYIENISEATCACLITMVKGNVLAITVAHWVIALETGVIAGLIASTAILSAKLRRQWVISLTLGLVTAIIDYVVHSGPMIVPAILESIITGLGAAALSYIVSLIFNRMLKTNHII